MRHCLRSLLLRLGKRYLGFDTTEALAQVDVVVVLGGRVLLNGSLSSGVAKRAEKAASLLNTRIANAIILSGGSNRRMQSEAIAMEAVLNQWLARNDIDVVIENQSQSTLDSARNCTRIMKSKGWHTAVVVTSPYHVSRAIDAFRSFGVDVIGCPAFSPGEYANPTHLYVIVYEVGARVKRAIWKAK